MISVPRFPLVASIETWDDLTLAAATTYLEAESEPVEGQLGVAWRIRARSERWALTIRQVILGPEGGAYADGRPFEPFSCWGDDYRALAEARLGSALKTESCWRAAAGALWRLLPDPAEGALFYLNVALTKAGRRKHDLPDWAADPQDKTCINQEKVVAVIGNHTFLRG